MPWRRFILAVAVGCAIATVEFHWFADPVLGAMYALLALAAPVTPDMLNSLIYDAARVTGILLPGLIVAVAIAIRRRPRFDEPRCRNCGYILRGLAEPRCPECGERV